MKIFNIFSYSALMLRFQIKSQRSYLLPCPFSCHDRGQWWWSDTFTKDSNMILRLHFPCMDRWAVHSPGGLGGSYLWRSQSKLSVRLTRANISPILLFSMFGLTWLDSGDTATDHPPKPSLRQAALMHALLQCCFLHNFWKSVVNRRSPFSLAINKWYKMLCYG